MVGAKSLASLEQLRDGVPFYPLFRACALLQGRLQCLFQALYQLLFGHCALWEPPLPAHQGGSNMSVACMTS
ncbi:hypothetical protein DUNSADRAFT_15042 [Dunaliella salina]|uniref:Uncharacterized protein n=1 Tax=Dunaliella salina TaxID=3046 RepID=A0ABQ7G651_DUNSA|nr:hypothetical protein DUNSADRAFT_15042 [Dunaliella salina]|eukprot:KAF5830081.1 hypothetical protein DUNSADRAFT_15042 [Dunaliella salina]